MSRRLTSLSVILLALLAASACARKEQVQGVEEASAEPSSQTYFAESGHAPPFSRTPYEPFRRNDAVAIAVQEWQLFGKPVDDDPPHTRPPPPPDENPERQAGH